MGNQSACSDLLRNTAIITGANVNVALWELLRQKGLLNVDVVIIPSDGRVAHVPIDILLSA